MAEATTRSKTKNGTLPDAPTTVEQFDVKVIRGIDGSTFELRRLGIWQLLDIMRLGAHAAQKMDAEQQKVLAGAANAAASDLGTAMQSFPVMLSVFDNDTVAEFLNRITGREKEWCGQNIGLAELAQLAEGLADMEQLHEVIASFRRVGGRWRLPSANSDQR